MARAAQYKKKPNQKMGRGPKQTFLQRRYTDGQQPYKKMFNITNYQRNANQNYVRHCLTPARMAMIKVNK